MATSSLFPAAAALTGWRLDFTYYFPWKYLGIRFQGAGVEISSSTFTGTITGPNNSFHFSRSNSFGAGAFQLY
jgi:hypothetical protein